MWQYLPQVSLDADVCQSRKSACLVRRSNERSFKTLNAAGARKGITIGVFGDLGDTMNSSTTIAHLIANSPDIVLNTGDYVYAGASLE